MADKIKVQGSLNICLETLQYYANKYEVSYSAHFGAPDLGKTWLIIPEDKKSFEKISIHFNWRSEYQEYDNSA